MTVTLTSIRTADGLFPRLVVLPHPAIEQTVPDLGSSSEVGRGMGFTALLSFAFPLSCRRYGK